MASIEKERERESERERGREERKKEKEGTLDRFHLVHRMDEKKAKEQEDPRRRRNLKIKY